MDSRNTYIRTGILVCLLLGSVSATLAQNQTPRVTPTSNIWYYEYLPPGYDASTDDYPILFHFHGIGERGNTETSLASVANLGPPYYVKTGYQFPFIVISPQLKTTFGDWPPWYIDEVVEHVRTYLRIDPKRMYFTGLSLGGGGAWYYAQDYPGKIAALAVICGSRNLTSRACNLTATNMPVWAFHGDNDSVVPMSRTVNMINAINACTPGPNPAPIQTIYPGAWHDIWWQAYRTDNSLHTPNVYQWMMGHTNNSFATANAGPDRVVTLPTATLSITATASSTVGSIVAYKWIKTKGPAVTMAGSTTATLNLSGLVEGEYTFRVYARTATHEEGVDDVKVTVNAAANTCACDHTIPAGAGKFFFNGATASPGQTICLEAGVRGGVQFTNLKGTASNPITIKNCGGEAVLGGSSIDNVILFIGSEHVRLTGTGDPSYQRGIRITSTAAGSQAIAAVGLSTDLEIDHIEIESAGYTGMMIKSDPSNDCSNTSAVRPNFTMRNIRIHDNFVHDTGGEGIYLGVSFYNGTTVYCGSTQYNHEVRGVRIYNNRFERTGREAIQVGSAVADVEVHNNTVIQYGQANLSAQNGGIQFGLGTVGRLYNNFIKGGTGPAIAIQGIGNDYVYNNIIVNAGEYGITVNTRPTPLSTDIVPTGFIGGVYIINNTFVNPSSSGVITEFINAAPGNVLYNNLIAGGPANWDKLQTTTDWTKGNNVYYSSVAAANFTNPAADDYSLLATSSAVNAGIDVSSFGVTRDYLNQTRPSGGSWDIGAFERISAANIPPVANAGADQTITLPTNSVTLNGSGTDSDGSITSYLWTQVSGPNTATLAGASTQNLTASNLVAGTYVFRLRVTDNNGATHTDEVTVTVNPAANVPPVANAGADQTITLPTNSVTLNGSGTDSDGTITSYLWTQVSGPNTATLAGASTQNLTASGLVAGTYVFRLRVTDNNGATHTDEVTVTVNPAANVPPVANAGADQSITLPTNTVTLNGSGTDSDGTISSYLWTQVSGPNTATLAGASTQNLTASGLVAGSYVFRLEVTDNNGAKDSDEANVVVQNDPSLMLFITNSFSPNNDGFYDTWRIENASQLEGCLINVVNRQGVQVYTSNGYAIPWDGSSGSQLLPAGVYFYSISCPDKKPLQGSVTILK